MNIPIKLTDLLNILSIGVLFQVCLYLFLLNIDKNSLPFDVSSKILNSFIYMNPNIAMGLIIFLSFPSWRIVSSLVEYVMYSNISRKIKFSVMKKFRYFYKILRILTSWYRRFFFGLRRTDSIMTGRLIDRILKSSNEMDLFTQKNIAKTFNIDLTKIERQESRRLFYLIKSYLSIHCSRYSTLYSQRYNTVLNYHVRLSIIFHLAFYLSLILTILSAIGSKNHNISFAICSFTSFLLCRYFSSSHKDFSIREVELLIHEFNSIVCPLRVK